MKKDIIKLLFYEKIDQNSIISRKTKINVNFVNNFGLKIRLFSFFIKIFINIF